MADSNRTVHYRKSARAKSGHQPWADSHGVSPGLLCALSLLLGRRTCIECVAVDLIHARRVRRCRSQGAGLQDFLSARWQEGGQCCLLHLLGLLPHAAFVTSPVPGSPRHRHVSRQPRNSSGLIGTQGKPVAHATDASLSLCAHAAQVRVLILGLDNAGKTTILYKLQMGEVRAPQTRIRAHLCRRTLALQPAAEHILCLPS